MRAVGRAGRQKNTTGPNAAGRSRLPIRFFRFRLLRFRLHKRSGTVARAGAAHDSHPRRSVDDPVPSPDPSSPPESIAPRNGHRSSPAPRSRSSVDRLDASIVSTLTTGRSIGGMPASARHAPPNDTPLRPASGAGLQQPPGSHTLPARTLPARTCLHAGDLSGGLRLGASAPVCSTDSISSTDRIKRHIVRQEEGGSVPWRKMPQAGAVALRVRNLFPHFLRLPSQAFFPGVLLRALADARRAPRRSRTRLHGLDLQMHG
jgi:hypothetical protein